MKLRNTIGKTIMDSRYIGLMFHIDTNRINARGKLENMNKLKEWAKNGVITLEMSEVTLDEASAGNNAQRTRKAREYIYSMTYATTQDEKTKLQKIEDILFPGGADNDNKRNDVEIVFNAAKYHRILITNDGGSSSQPNGMLGNASILKSEIDVDVITDTEAVARVEKMIEARDSICRHHAGNTGDKLPDWIGKD